MKLEHYQLNDISNLLCIPKTTLRDRFKVIGIEPSVKKRFGRVTKHYYSKRQVDTIKRYYEIYGHKIQPKPPIDLIKGYEIIDSVCFITVESKINFMK